MILNIIILNEQDVEFINSRNTETNSVVVCDYGYGACIDDSFLDLEGYDDVKQYIADNNLQWVKVDVDIDI